MNVNTIYIIATLVLLILILVGAWIISISDLPEWFKFFLLK